MRTLCTIMALCCYSISFNTYLVMFGSYASRYMKLWYNYMTLAFLVFIFIDEMLNFKSSLHKQFNDICKATLITNYILIIMYHHSYADSGFTKFTIFNGTVLVVTSLILYSGRRHGIIKDTYNDGE